MTAFTWRRTLAPLARRNDDIWFVDALVGWTVNSNGQIWKTTDGGDTWTRQMTLPNTYLRCIGFADAERGWVGTLSPAQRLLHTSDGGTTWSTVPNLPALAPSKVCGISVVNPDVVYASGTNDPVFKPRMMKTVDGGETWTAWEMREHASVLIDTLFLDELRGWVVGGISPDPDPQSRDELKPVVLFTADGGQTWVDRLAGQGAEFPFGEWGWKIQFVDALVGFVSLENFNDAAILKTTDGGLTWTRMRVNDPQRNANLEGIGFLDDSRGWVGGWGDADFETGRTSGTDDGGTTWRDANDVGRFINRFRFIGKPLTVGYASGDTVYKLTDAPAPALVGFARAAHQPRVLLPQADVEARERPIAIPIVIPRATTRATLSIWTRFGEHVGNVLDEVDPTPGARVFVWDGGDARGSVCGPGTYIVRLTADAEVESSYLILRPGRPRKSQRRKLRWVTHRLALPPRSALHALAPAVGGVTELQLPDLSWLATPIEKARFLLETAAEVEHALLVQYLYAGYSLKRPADVNSAEERAALKAWRLLLAGIAKEEMGHLMTVQNLLVLLGQRLNFEREDFPAPAGLYPFKMRLEPLHQASLAKYVVAESPVDASGVDDIVAQATGSAGAEIHHVGVLYAMLGVVFSRADETAANALGGDAWHRAVRDVGALALLQEPGRERWYLPDDAFDASTLERQATDAEWSPASEVRIFATSGRAGALAALRDIGLQGEGPVQPTDDPKGSHFQRFVGVYRGTAEIAAFPPAIGWVPARAVPVDPVLDSPAGDPRLISSPKARDYARLGDLRYALLLGFLEHTYSVAPGLRKLLVAWSFNEMRLLQAFSDVLTTTPRIDGGTVEHGVAALTFTLPDQVHLPDGASERWQVHIDRLGAAVALAGQMLASHSAGDGVLTQMVAHDEERSAVARSAQAGTLPVPVVGRFELVRRILDGAMGFGSARTHGKFWQQPLADFIAGEFGGDPFIAPPGADRGKRSNLIKALKGEEPFDGSVNDRMPARRSPVSADHIAFIESWIDADCPEI